MTWQTLTGRRVGLLAAILSLAVLAAGVGSHLAAQVADDGLAAAPEAAPPPKPKRRRGAHRTPAEPPAAAETAALPAVTAPATAAEPIDFAAQLDKAGASACHGQVNALATSTMGSVVAYNTMSNWSGVAGGKHAVSVAIGQKYADGSLVPFSVSQVISAPNQQGSCDGFTVQVFPSPLSCSRLRETLAARGRQIGDLAGIPLMQDADGRTMLLPTAANTCVLVATRTVYAR